MNTDFKIFKSKLKYSDCSLTIDEIWKVFVSTSPRVLDKDLDPSLWQPYESWVDKVWEMPITIPDGESRSKELRNFKEQMIKAIKEAENVLKIREEREREERRKRREEQIKEYHQNEQDKITVRLDTIRQIKDEAWIYGEDWESIDNSLWVPYETWEEKIEKIEIKSRVGRGIDTSELNKFKEEIIKVIRKKDEENEEKYKKEQAEFWVNEEKRCNIESIEELMTEKGIKSEELGTYSNYKEKINNLDKRWEIISSAEEVINYMWDEIIMKRDYGPTPNTFNSAWNNLQDELREENKKELEDEVEQLKNQNSETQTPEQQAETQKKLSEKEEELKKIEESNNEESNRVQEKEKLEKELQKLKDQGNQEKLTKRIEELERVVEQLKIENENLKQQIQKLKEENDNTPEYKSYLAKKEQKLQMNQSKLQQLESIITHNNNNPWPITPVIISLGFITLLGLIVYKLSRRKVRR
jgi:hypothetical protein